MKQITLQACHAFKNDKNFSLSNTVVKTDATGTYMYLFGNLIAKKCNKRVAVSLAGWNSNTTKERLRGLGANITTKKGLAYLNNEPMELREFYIL